MFYYLKGTVAEIGQGVAVMDCAGVGFAVNTSMNTLSQIRVGTEDKLYISEQVREDAFDLYGFKTLAEKNCFEMLISVSGVGPKAAVSILSANTPEGVCMAVMSGNEKALMVAQGIGKKIAQRVILELKDKVSKEMNSSAADLTSFTPMAVQSADSAVNDALAGLTVLGYSSAEIAPVLKKLDTQNMTAEQIIKSVLKQMVK